MSIVLLGATSGSVTLAEPAVGGSTTINIPAASGTMAVLPTATGVLAEAAGGTGTTTGYTGFKNRIINGDMRIDQRNAGASVTVDTVNFGYTADRWGAIESTDGVMTAQQVATAPTGFTNSLKLTTTTADATLGATQFAYVGQRIEGYNVADLEWGTANAKTVTVSFWVRSSLTGTFGGSIYNGGSNRSYPFTYTISVADTWEQKSVTITGDTSGTWLTTNGIGLILVFGLGVGSTYSGTAGAWVGSLAFSATGAVSVVGTINATFYITGVQLEKGATATSFDYRDYGRELIMCQRYYFQDNTTIWRNALLDGGLAEYPTVFINFPVEMRSAPTGAFVAAATIFYYNNGTGSASFTPSGGGVGSGANRISAYIFRSSVTNYPGAAHSQKAGQWSTQISFNAEL